MTTLDPHRCSVPDCARPVYVAKSSLCLSHYRRQQRHGDPLGGGLSTAAPAPERFWAQVDRRRGDECWPWLGSMYHDGYGRFGVNYRDVRAHRFAYELMVGPIPHEAVLDHLCRTRSCVNPAHLEPVSNRENILRGMSPAAVNATKTHCKRGHEFSPENTRIDADGYRICLPCKRWHKRQAAS